MSDVRDFKFSFNASGTSHTGTMPDHETGDTLVFVMGGEVDFGTITGGTGWTELGITPNWAAFSVSQRIFYQYNVTAPVSAPTFTVTNNGASDVCVIALKDVPTTSVILAHSTTGATYSTADGMATAPAVTATAAKQLVLGIHSADNGYVGWPVPSAKFLGTTDRGGGGVSLWKIPTTGSGSAGGIEYATTDGTIITTLLIADSGGSALPYAVPGSDFEAEYCAASACTTNEPATLDSKDTELNYATANFSLIGMSGNHHPALATNIDTRGMRVASTFALDDFSVLQFKPDTGKSWDCSSGSTHFLIQLTMGTPTWKGSLSDVSEGGVTIGAYSDLANQNTTPEWNAWPIFGGSSTEIQKSISGTSWGAVIDVTKSGTVLDSAGTFDTSQVDAFFLALTCDTAHSQNVEFGMYHWVTRLDTMYFLGGDSTTPITVEAMFGWLGSTFAKYQNVQGTSQLLTALPLSIGDGTNPVHADITAGAIEFVEDNSAGDNRLYHIADTWRGVELYTASSSDKIHLTNSVIKSDAPFYFRVHASANADADWSLSGLQVIGPGATTINTITHTGITFSGRDEITLGSGSLAGGCTIDDCGSGTQAVTVTSEAEFNKLLNCDFTNNDTLSILITGNHGGSTWTGTGMTVAGGGGSYDIQYTGTGTLTIAFDTGSGWTQGRANATVGTLTLTVPTTDVTINVNIAADIKLFDGASTQTATDSEASATQLVYTYSGTKTWYYTVQLAGYIPQRGSVSGTDEDLTVNVTLVADPVYNASHGLTFNTDYSYNPTTRVMTIAAAQQGRDLLSAMIDDFISESTLFNRPFPLKAIGPDRIDFTSDGTTAATIDSDDVKFWLGAGMEWEHATTGNPTHKYCSIVGTGTNASGTKGFIQQVDGASPTDITTQLVSNNVNQVIRYYRDDNGDGDTSDASEYDYSGHLVVKLFNDGYYQRSVDVLTQYGISALESFEYVIPLQMTETGLGTGDRSITITVTDNTPAGVEEQTGYTFDYKIEGGASDAPADLLRQWIYDVYTDPTASDYASKVNFNWPDPIIESGGNYETQRGFVYGQDTTTTYSGFYVEEGSDYHPDFLRQQANDGTYFTTPIVATVSVTGMQNSGSASRTLLHIFNVTASTSSAWQATTAYAVGDRVLRTSGLGIEETGGLWYLCTTAGTSSGTEPASWNTTPGGTTNDGTVVWTTYKALVYADDPASDAYATTYTDGEEYAAGDSLRIRHAETVGATSHHQTETTVVVGSAGWSVVLAPVADTVYAANAVDGSAVTGFALNVAALNFRITLDQDFTAEQAYAWFCYELTGDNGMHNFWGSVTAIDSSNYRINQDIADVYFDENIGAFVKQIASGAGLARIFREDGARPAIDPTSGGYGIEINWQNPVYLAETGSVTAAGVASEVITQLNSTAQSEPTGAPAANASLGAKIGYLFMMMRNKVTVTASSKTFHDDDGNAEFSKALSDDGTTYTEDEAA